MKSVHQKMIWIVFIVSLSIKIDYILIVSDWIFVIAAKMTVIRLGQDTVWLLADLLQGQRMSRDVRIWILSLTFIMGSQKSEASRPSAPPTQPHSDKYCLNLRNNLELEEDEESRREWWKTQMSLLSFDPNDQHLLVTMRWLDPRRLPELLHN